MENTPEFIEAMALLQTIADIGKTGDAALKTIKHCVEKKYIEAETSVFRPWRLTETGCEALATYILSKDEETEQSV